MCRSPLRTIHPAPNRRYQEVEMGEKYVWLLYGVIKSITIKCPNMPMFSFSRNSIPKPKTCRITLRQFFFSIEVGIVNVRGIWFKLHKTLILYIANSVPFGQGLKQQNRYLSVIIVCGYFSFIRSFTCLNFPSKSNSYHNTSLSTSFGCWHLSGTPLCPLHFTVYTIAWQRKFEPKWIFNINLCILSG